MRSNTLFLALLSTVSMAAFAHPAAAQSPVPVASADEAADAGLEDIVVTAQRKSESAQRAGLAISVVSSDRIFERNITQPAELNKIVPAVQIQQAGGSATTFFVRGVGNFAVNGFTDPAVAFNYDGVYIGRSTSNGGLLYDLERVEVLKGPQGTLYGRNATSGAINIIPAKPKPGENGAFLSAAYGNYDALNLQGYANIAIGDEGALRISALRSKRDGYLSDGSSDENMTAVRAQMLAHLTDNLTVRAGLDYSHMGGAGQGSSYAFSYRLNRATGTYTFTPSGLGSNVGLFDPAAQAFRQTLFIGLSGRNAAPLDKALFLRNNFYGANGEITWKSPIGTLTVIPAWRSGKLNQTFAIPAFEAFLQEKQDQQSIEARLSGEKLFNFMDYVLGAFAYHETVDGNYTFNQQGLSPFTNFNSKTTAKALFARLTGHVTDRLRVVGGIRYTNEKKHFDGRNDQILVVCTVTVQFVPSCPNAPLLPTVDMPSQVGFPVPAASGGVVPIGTTGAIAQRRLVSVVASTKVNKVNFRAAAEFDIGPRSLLYASFENGFRSGGFSLSLGHETYRPETINAFTIGMKNRLLDNRLQFNIEGFIWKYRDQQVTHPGIDATGAQSQFTENVGRSTNKGVEVEAQYLPLPDTLLTVNVQYLDAKYDSFTYQVPVGNAPPVTGCAFTRATPTATMYTIDCSGFRAYQSPKWTANLGAQQSFHLGTSELILRADTQYRSSRYVAFDYLSFQNIGGTWISGAQVSLKPGGTPFTISAYIQNIENNRTPVASGSLALASVYTYNVTPPRTYGMRVSAKF